MTSKRRRNLEEKFTCQQMFFKDKDGIVWEAFLRETPFKEIPFTSINNISTLPLKPKKGRVV